ncbi:MAG TPA: phospholipase D family protein [Steroidobacteraceae bacterium]|nr:phospholipase D family protein [Steroidobacteraceae bacterium]
MHPRLSPRLIGSLCAALLLLCGCVTAPPGRDYPRTVSVALADPQQTALGSRFEALSQAHSGASAFHILNVGVDGLLSRVQMIDTAQKTLDLQYFIFRADTTGRLILDALTRAAGRGVAIRLLIDDGDTVAGDEQVDALGSQPGVQVRVFNPFRYRGHNSVLRALEFVGNSARLDYRMHNKLLVVDNSLALIGGRNIGNEYFQVDPQAQSADDDVFVAGPIVHTLSETFDEYWNSDLAVPAAALYPHGVASPARHRRARAQVDGIDYSARIASGEPFASLLDGRLSLVWASAQVWCDTPDKKRTESGDAGHVMVRDFLAAARQVNREFLMINPYIVPTQGESNMLKELRDRQVQVGIITNSLQSTRDPLAFAGYTRSRKDLLRHGINLYEVRAQLGSTRGSGQTPRVSRLGTYGLHGKLVVFDRQRVFIGSMNFDERSRHLNTEIGLLIDSPELADLTAARFNAMAQLDNAYQPALLRDASGHERLQWTTRENGAEVVYHKEPAPNAWRRLLSHLLALLPVRREL